MPFRKLPGAKLCRFNKGDYLIKQGERLDYLYYLVQGTVYRETTSIKGNEIILGVKKGSHAINSLVAVLSLYNHNSVTLSNNNFIAKTKCTCYKIPKNSCRSYLKQHPEMLEELISMSLDEYEDIVRILQDKSERNCSAGLCEFLLQHSCKTDEGLIISKKWTNIELAKKLSMHKVTVSRILRELNKQEVLRKNKDGWVIVDENLLKEYSNSSLQLHYK